MDWFLYDNGLRHERVNSIAAAYEIFLYIINSMIYKYIIFKKLFQYQITTLLGAKELNNFRSSRTEVFLGKGANLQENTHAEVRFQ